MDNDKPAREKEAGFWVVDQFEFTDIEATQRECGSLNGPLSRMINDFIMREKASGKVRTGFWLNGVYWRMLCLLVNISLETFIKEWA